MALNSRFMSTANLQNTVRLIGAFGIFSLGLGLVITTGGIDLSVGLAFALLGVVLSIMLTEWHLAWPVAVLTVIARRGPRRLPRSADHSPGSAAFHRHALRACCCIAGLPDSSPMTRQRDLATPPGFRRCSGSRPAVCSTCRRRSLPWPSQAWWDWTFLATTVNTRSPRNRANCLVLLSRALRRLDAANVNRFPSVLLNRRAAIQEIAVQRGGDLVAIVTFLVRLSLAQQGPASDHVYIQIRRTSASSCSCRALTQGA
jgi:hypothetical protein